jgi:uncharacterized protein (DUF58 family)
MLPRELLKKIRKIEITTNRVVQDTLAGQYHSVFKGRGMAFAEVRQYFAGDDIRAIDWNVTARMREPFIKVFAEERELTVMLLVDRSASGEVGTRAQTMNEMAAEIAAMIAFSAITNNDRVGLILFTDRVELFVPPKKGRKHVLRLISEILDARAEGRGTDIAGALEHMTRTTRRRAVVFAVSDFLSPQPKWEHALAIASRRNDCIPIVLRDPIEEAIPDLGFLHAEDAETGAVVRVDTSDRRVREAYAQFMDGAREERVRLFHKLSLDHIEMRAGEDYVKPLAGFFRRRARRLAA